MESERFRDYRAAAAHCTAIPPTATCSRFSRALLRAILFVGLAAIATGSGGQSFESLPPTQKPLILDSTGSFFVGGETVSQTATEVGLYVAGPIVVNQMYVQYMVPHHPSKPPIVMIHGGTLSGKSFETTPDGRMGWYEYFVRRGFPSYVVDQVGRGRSGFNQAPFNDVRAGIASPTSQPNIRRTTSDRALVRFRITTEDGRPFADTQFPWPAAAELAKQNVPDLYEGLPADNPNFRALAELATDLKGAVLLSHSQAGQYPFEAALLDPTHVRAIVAIEPPGCKATTFTDAQIVTLSRIPILVVFGDHIDAPQRVGLVQWPDAMHDCEAFIRRAKAAGGRARLIHLPEIGIRGNSHMMMQDKNNREIADLIIRWISDNVR